MPSKHPVLAACIILLFALSWLIAAVSCHPSQSNGIRILISTEKSDRLDFAVSGTVRLKSLTLSQGSFHVELQNGTLLLYDSQNNKLASGNTLVLSSGSSEGFVKIYNRLYGNACYAGSVTVSPDRDGHLRVVETIPVDAYIQSVVSCCGDSLPEEAIKALTVIVHNYTAACVRGGSSFDTSDEPYPYAGSLSCPESYLPVMRQVLNDRLVSDGSFLCPELRGSNGGVYRIIPSSPETEAVEISDRFDGTDPGSVSQTPSGSCISLRSVQARAEAGHSYQEILSAYFPYASLVHDGNTINLSDRPLQQ